jgi:hypothetical protein
MNTEQRQANEKYFVKFIHAKTKLYMWKDNGNCYDMSSGKIKPYTIKGYVELSAIVRKPFMKMFVELPTDGDWDEKKVWDIIDAVSK